MTGSDERKVGLKRPVASDGHRPSSLRCEKCNRHTAVLAKIGDLWLCPFCRSMSRKATP